MIISSIRDGLGNQMFIYAAAREVQYITGERLYIDTSFYNTNNERTVELNEFKLNKNVKFLNGFQKKIICFYEKAVLKLHKKDMKFGQCGFFKTENDGFTYKHIDHNKSIKILKGFFQNQKYFKDIRRILISEFEPKKAFSALISAKIKEIKQSEAVCVHVRRGDYIDNDKWSKILNVCTQEYYVNSMKYIDEKISNAKFYVFSNNHNDIEWIKANYNFSQFNVEFVDMNNTSVDELMLMKSCKHFVISNSTFSWWAQYLSENDDKIVCAPSVWHKQNEDSKYMITDNMKVINVQ